MASASASASASGSSTAVAPSNSSATPSNSREQAEARAAVLASLQSAGSAYDSQLQQRAADLHQNAATITKQEQELKKHTAVLAKEADVWRKEADKASSSLKEFGDLQNWAEMMERDLLVVEETLRLAENGEQVESASGGSAWKQD